ncbi:hypothetical protein MT884_002159 [Enterococcus faecalis]|nr:hypothetical protein [Enterococcus faecalis]
MDRVVIPFDKEDISVDELKEHIDYYVGLANEGQELVSSGNKKEARDILRQINQYLDQEYRYYDRVKVSNAIFKNELYRIYKRGISDAYIKQNKKNSYTYLHSNFYDIKDYLTGYGMEKILK